MKVRGVEAVLEGEARKGKSRVVEREQFLGDENGG